MPFSLPTTRRRVIRRSVAIAAIAVALLPGVPAPLFADHFNQVGQLQFVNAWTRPANAGESTRLHMKIVNDGFDDLHVIKLTSPIAAKVRLVLTEARGQTVLLPSITVLARETMDLSSSSFHVILDGLSRDLQDGEQIPLILHIAPAGRITTSVAVGETADRGAS
jgi:copper(I)-binding protein